MKVLYPALDTKPTGLLRLLFAREVFDLDSGHSIPHPRGITPIEGLAPPHTPKNVAERWDGLWAARELAYAEDAIGRATAAPPLPEPPAEDDPWSAEAIASEAFERAFFSWSWPLREAGKSFDREKADGVREAIAHESGKGLRAIIVLPLSAPYVSRPSTARLIISDWVRERPAAYREALLGTGHPG